MMSKIEEITEILVNEINDFNKNVTRLETINKKLETIKVSIDLVEYKSIMESHQQKMALILNSQERILNRFESLLKNAKIYPNWAVIVLIISILISSCSLFYVYTVKQNAKKLENEAHQKSKVTFNGIEKDLRKKLSNNFVKKIIIHKSS